MYPTDHQALRIDKLEDLSAVVQLAEVGPQDPLQAIAFGGSCGVRTEYKILTRIDEGPRGKNKIDTAGKLPFTEVKSCAAAIEELDKLQAVLAAVIENVVVQLCDDDVEIISAKS